MKKLNKISILFLSLIVLVFASCENEPLEGEFEDGSTSNTGLVGTWTLVDFNSSVNSSTVFNGMDIASDIVIDGFNPDYDITFTETAFTAFGRYDYSVDIDITGQPTMSNNYSLENVTGAGVYSTNGNQMTVDGSFFEFTFEGVDDSAFQGEQTVTYTISADGQTLTFTQNETQTDGAGGVSTTVTNVGSSVWSKIANTNTSCEDASDFATSAEAAYNNDNTNTDLCNAYKSALQNQINACGDASGEIQSVIDGLGDCDMNANASIIGTWELISYTVNGVEFPGVCLGDIEIFTATTYHYQEVWGDNCENLNDGGPLESYTLNGNQLTIVEEGTPYTYEVLEISETTLRYQDAYTENGVDFIDVNTYERQ